MRLHDEFPDFERKPCSLLDFFFNPRAGIREGRLKKSNATSIAILRGRVNGAHSKDGSVVSFFLVFAGGWYPRRGAGQGSARGGGGGGGGGCFGLSEYSLHPYEDVFPGSSINHYVYGMRYDCIPLLMSSLWEKKVHEDVANAIKREWIRADGERGGRNI